MKSQKLFSFLPFVLSVVPKIMTLSVILCAASNPFHKDHQREEPQGASNTSTREAVGLSAPGLQSSAPAQPDSLSSLQCSEEDTRTGLDKCT